MASILPEWRTKAKPENVQLLFDAAPVKGKVAPARVAWERLG